MTALAFLLAGLAILAGFAITLWTWCRVLDARLRDLERRNHRGNS